MFEIFCLKIHKFNQFGCDTTLLVDLLSLTFPGECLQNLELTIRKKNILKIGVNGRVPSKFLSKEIWECKT